MGWLLVIQIAGALLSLPMATQRACETALENFDAGWVPFCIDQRTGEVLLPKPQETDP